ncbi:unnamed protein product [Pleuronectes platessa]|uniref:Uncharacterized protein n=1 Tax=Pleuronectes platessa TaxID=8262 RepID=A0A9N7YPH1_PLEPL|nr:unnamed protein product [Pleuronectes platessa]
MQPRGGEEKAGHCLGNMFWVYRVRAGAGSGVAFLQELEDALLPVTRIIIISPVETPLIEQFLSLPLLPSDSSLIKRRGGEGGENHVGVT